MVVLTHDFATGLFKKKMAAHNLQGLGGVVFLGRLRQQALDMVTARAVQGSLYMFDNRRLCEDSSTLALWSGSGDYVARPPPHTNEHSSVYSQRTFYSSQDTLRLKALCL